MRRKPRKPPRVLKVEETQIGRELAMDPAARARFKKIVEEIREAVRPEIEDLERMGRITGEDLATMVY